MPIEQCRHRSRREIIFIVLLTLFIAMVGVSSIGGEVAPVDVRDQIAELRYENSVLGAKVDLAKSGKFYLIADFPDRKIHLMIRGVSLRAFSLERLEIGRRELFFVPLSSDVSFKNILNNGVIAPQRVIERYQIVPPPPEEVEKKEQASDENAPPPPPTPESKQIDVPHIFKLIFKEGLEIEIVSMEIDKESPGFWERMETRLRLKFTDIASIFQSGKELRLRISMRADDFRNFYRAVPDQIDMIVLTEPIPK